MGYPEKSSLATTICKRRVRFDAPDTSSFMKIACQRSEQQISWRRATPVTRSLVSSRDLALARSRLSSIDRSSMPALMTQATALAGLGVSARPAGGRPRSAAAGGCSRKSVKVRASTDPLLLRVARGEQGERPPVWLMRQAGRYMAEFREYSNKYGFRHRSETPDIAIELSLQPWRAFNTDGVIMFSDILTPLPALGVEFDVVKARPRRSPHLTSLETKKYPITTFHRWFPPPSLRWHAHAQALVVVANPTLRAHPPTMG